MRRVILLLGLLFIPLGYDYVNKSFADESRIDECQQLYSQLGLEGVVDYTAFSQAFTGYNTIEGRSKDILVIVDFTKPSTEKRFYVIDMKDKELLFVTHVSHGKNSGENYATSFSNVSGSHKSSLGFYLTEKPYIGGNGLSLLLDGLEKGINDKARERAIVIHGAAYANPSVVAGGAGRLGRSHGCPALPEALAKPIIDFINNGALLYIYANSSEYIAHSTVLSGKSFPQPLGLL